mmetsp:Transcript_163176/g.523333  ORF Transcript_163176/g.523333 Transcript_163176/m.523333 type:complete len:262 (+) Transcript_163176:192-977(+)
MRSKSSGATPAATAANAKAGLEDEAVVVASAPVAEACRRWRRELPRPCFRLLLHTGHRFAAGALALRNHSNKHCSWKRWPQRVCLQRGRSFDRKEPSASRPSSISRPRPLLEGSKSSSLPPVSSSSSSMQPKQMTHSWLSGSSSTGTSTARFAASAISVPRANISLSLLTNGWAATMHMPLITKRMMWASCNASASHAKPRSTGHAGGGCRNATASVDQPKSRKAVVGQTMCKTLLPIEGAMRRTKTAKGKVVGTASNSNK